MSCSATKRISGDDWPLYRESESGDCCYVVNVGSKTRAVEVAADAEQMPGYIKRSRFYHLPANRIQFYLYFAN